MWTYLLPRTLPMCSPHVSHLSLLPWYPHWLQLTEARCESHRSKLEAAQAHAEKEALAEKLVRVERMLLQYQGKHKLAPCDSSSVSKAPLGGATGTSTQPHTHRR